LKPVLPTRGLEPHKWIAAVASRSALHRALDFALIGNSKGKLFLKTDNHGKHGFTAK
jgi:hypothetical protein